MISVATMLGALSLSLRSLQAEESADGQPAPEEPDQAYRGRSLTTDHEVSRLISRESDTHEVVIARGNQKTISRLKRAPN
jgi:hypothetical protein